MVILKKALQIAAFAVVFLLILLWLQGLVVPPYDWPDSFDRLGDGVRGLYRESDDSLQVLFLGTSHVRNGVSPMLIYRDTGIRSYNLATAAQTTALSWSRLKLALKRQSPKVVLLDASACFYPQKYAEGKKSEATWRKVLDSLSRKRVADRFGMACDMQEMSTAEPDDLLACMLPFFRYHDNYLFTESQPRHDDAERIALLKGYCHMEYRTADSVAARIGSEAEAEAEAFEDPESEAQAAEQTAKLEDRLAYNRTYIERMAALCRENGGELVLMKVPVNLSAAESTSYWDAEKHDMIAELAKELGCRFVDMNFGAIDIDWVMDSSDGGTHLNSSGARKASAFLANWLTENCGLDGRKDAAWDEQLAVYEWEDRLYRLQMESDPDAYLDLLAEGDYTVFVTVSGSPGKYWSDALQAKLARTTGAQVDLRDAFDEGGKTAYALVTSGGEALSERAHKTRATAKGTLADGTEYRVTAKKSGAGITIGSMSSSSSAPGMHFVVYSNELHCVFDDVHFYTAQESTPYAHALRSTRTSFRQALAEYERLALGDT